ncbi:MAG: Rid family detoxifying hydrolase [Chlamydiota bacterium]
MNKNYANYFQLTLKLQAELSKGRRFMHQMIQTDKAPQAIGPYSQAIFADDLLFVSGQIPINPLTEKLVSDEIKIQTKQVLDNIEAILIAAGFTLEDVVKTEVYMKDLAEFTQMNELYSERFCFKIKPARQAMQVVKLPLDARIEISCIAKKNSKS